MLKIDIPFLRDIPKNKMASPKSMNYKLKKAKQQFKGIREGGTRKGARNSIKKKLLKIGAILFIALAL